LIWFDHTPEQLQVIKYGKVHWEHTRIHSYQLLWQRIATIHCPLAINGTSIHRCSQGFLFLYTTEIIMMSESSVATLSIGKNPLWRQAREDESFCDTILCNASRKFIQYLHITYCEKSLWQIRQCYLTLNLHLYRRVRRFWKLHAPLGGSDLPHCQPARWEFFRSTAAIFAACCQWEVNAIISLKSGCLTDQQVWCSVDFWEFPGDNLRFLKRWILTYEEACGDRPHSTPITVSSNHH